MTLSVRQAAKVMRKFRIEDGDVILVKNDTDLANEENMNALISGLKIIGHSHTIILVVDEFDNIKTVDETHMNEFGWYRIETLKNRIIRKIKEESDDEEKPSD